MADEKTTYVLVVDDNPTSMALYERVIQHVPLAFPKCFTSPQEALAWARDHLPTVVVVDYRMPDTDGFAFIRAFRTIPHRNRVPCIMLTGMKDTDIRREALELGVAEFLTKPVNPERLIQAIRDAIGRPSQSSET
jgi:putative two-component system response regulator